MFSIPPRGAQLILVLLVLCAAFFDARSRRIPNWLNATGIVAGFALNAFLYPGLSGVWLALKGLALGFGVYLFLHILHAMGAGDVKLMAAVGSIVGPSDWFGIFVITAIIGGILSIVVSIAKKRLGKTLFNVGFILSEMRSLRPAYLKNEELDVKSDKGVRMPHGVVIAFGSLVFLAISSRMGQ